MVGFSQVVEGDGVGTKAAPALGAFLVGNAEKPGTEPAILMKIVIVPSRLLGILPCLSVRARARHRIYDQRRNSVNAPVILRVLRPLAR